MINKCIIPIQCMSVLLESWVCFHLDLIVIDKHVSFEYCPCLSCSDWIISMNLFSLCSDYDWWNESNLYRFILLNLSSSSVCLIMMPKVHFNWWMQLAIVSLDSSWWICHLFGLCWLWYFGDESRLYLSWRILPDTVYMCLLVVSIMIDWKKKELSDLFLINESNLYSFRWSHFNEYAFHSV